MPRGEEARAYWRVFWGGVQIVALMIATMWAVVTVPNWLFKYIWNDLQSVTIENHRVGDNPQVTAYREIQRDSFLYWSVTIRTYGTDQFVDSIPLPEYVKIQASANSVNPLVMPLSKWIGPAGAIDRLERDPLYGAGTFYAVTCHHKWIWRRCVASAPYTRTEK